MAPEGELVFELSTTSAMARTLTCLQARRKDRISDFLEITRMSMRSFGFYLVNKLTGARHEYTRRRLDL